MEKFRQRQIELANKAKTGDRQAQRQAAGAASGRAECHGRAAEDGTRAGAIGKARSG